MRLPESELQEAPPCKSFADIAVRPAGLQPAGASVLNGGLTPAMLAIRGQGPRIAVEPDVRLLAVLDRAVRRGSGVPLPNELRTEWDARVWGVT
jgi:hypothetical protein